MKGIKKTLECRQGKTFIHAFRLKSADGNIIELPGFSAFMHVRETIDSEDTVLELSTDNGGIVIDEDLGKVTLFISATDTASLTVGNYIYDVELVSPDDVVYGPVIPSAFKVKPEVTRMVV